jgi:hypothetical protein
MGIKKENKKEVEKICIKCSKKILPKQKYIKLTTYFEDGKIVDEYFHFQCWQDFYKENINKKVDEFKNKAIITAKAMMKNVSNIIDNTVKSPEDLDVMIKKLPA